MTADEQPEEQEGASTPAPRRASRPAPVTSRSNTEKAMALELARLVGVSPRLLVNPDPAPKPDPPAAGDTTGDEENGDVGEDTTA
ncbi:MAG: hypothetical protein ACRD0C_23760 [Acidimicrobiia bacterium]